MTCARPRARCVCAGVVPVDNRVGITVIQHPGERDHPFNTARLAKLGLGDARVLVAWPDADGRVHLPADLPAGSALLYPSDSARELSEIPVEERPRHLVVLDGTWPQARSLYRDNPQLHGLPHVRLEPTVPGRYRIRAEPAPHCLSTIEAIHQALLVLEPETPGLDHLLAPFLSMVNTQAEGGRSAEPRHRHHPKPTLLDRLDRDWDQLLVCYGESVGLPRRGEAQQLLQWTAIRVSTGEVFEAVLPVDQPTNPCQVGLSPQESVSVARFAMDWAAFATESAVVASWSAGLPSLLASTTGRSRPTIPMRTAYGNLRGGVGGNLAQVLEREGRTVEPLEVQGRAADRLGGAVAMAELLRELHRERLPTRSGSPSAS